MARRIFLPSDIELRKLSDAVRAALRASRVAVTERWRGARSLLSRVAMTERWRGDRSLLSRVAVTERWRGVRSLLSRAALRASWVAVTDRSRGVRWVLSRWTRRYGWAVVTVAALLGVAWLEATTSVIESGVLSTIAGRLGYRVEASQSPTIAFPAQGPFDTQRGYALIPGFAHALEERGFRILEQARFSTGLMLLSRLGISPPDRDKPIAGLVIRDASADTLFNAMRGREVLSTYADIPPIVARSLLYIENRQLQAKGPATLNPALDWGRLCKATFLWFGRNLGLPVRVEGGSTLAVQLQKYRHSGGGRTHSPADKLRQIAGASLAAYRNGPSSAEERREVVLDYINTLPLSATPEQGEVSGLADGLRVWFGLDPDEVWRVIDGPGSDEERAAAYKPVLALLCAGQAPTRFLREDHAALERRVDAYTRLFQTAGVIPPGLAHAVRATPLQFAPRLPGQTGPFTVRQKSVYSLRCDLSQLLGVPNFYDLDRLDLEVQTTFDDSLQTRALRLFHELGDESFVATHGLQGEHLLSTGNPAGVTYSLLLYESTPLGARACAHIDNQPTAFDLNSGMKLELGSTAKLRTLAHYLELVHGLHGELAGLDADSLRERVRLARDPITEWVGRTLLAEPDMSVDTLLERALDRKYSASPYEVFFTGSGEQTFHNFDPSDNRRILPIREALVRSTNLVFVRLMRDLERYHQARLPYDATAALSNPDDPDRKRLLAKAIDDESRLILWRAYKQNRDQAPDDVVATALGSQHTVKRATALFYAWHRDTSIDMLAAWLMPRYPGLTPGDVRSLAHRLGNPDFTLLDYAYLVGEHPLELWCAGDRIRNPGAPWDSVWARSADARALCERWVMDPKHFRQQNLRIRPQIEAEAFAQMTDDWRRLGFPFQHLVPSYATAIGASGDRPTALADLMGIIVSGGVRRPALRIDKLVFGSSTPYHTSLAVAPSPEERVMQPVVARTLRSALAGVVARGTAEQLAGVFTDSDSLPLPIGGKTGSGDNRFDTFARGGKLISSRARSRTATFVFYLGERHYGVVTASVIGPAAEGYRFTSALPLRVIRLLAPALEDHLRASGELASSTQGRKEEPPAALAAARGD